ncbi:dihydrofolate reductase family protein [Nocardia yamanashiensis]|uniref:dihydrofolate reductase family protein n=1 Tax=Nocardia yamanashiensis TaxID=209247 RepID=UPI001E53BC2E|nr:dihydrofolate reductase family protein [Nocardia yamanashiensis]UGT39796.1 dihydrofolate reductase family protein [Nocardia yamanashiensis]
MTFSATVFIGTSLDGYIARVDDDIEWLTSRGEKAGDLGFLEFLDSVDAVIMGRKTYDKVIGFGAENWHYGNRHVGVLSTTLPDDADPRITVYRDLDSMIADLEARELAHVYPDGGRLIQSFLRAGRVDKFIISVAPVLIGAGFRLFGDLPEDVSLHLDSAADVGGGFAQLRYTVEKTHRKPELGE